MKCHYSHDETGYRFWLPGCWGGATGGPNFCTCRYVVYDPEKDKHKELRKIIKDQEKEIAILNRIIKKLVRKNSLTPSLKQ